jgi:hypothetical protein
MPTDLLGEDFLDLRPFANQINRNPVTVRRWMRKPDALPFVNRVLVHVPTAREWLYSRMRKPNPRRSTQRQESATL